MALRKIRLISHNCARLMCGAALLYPATAITSAYAGSLGDDVGIGRMKDQAGIKRGPWLILPSISNGLLYDSNLFGQETDVQDELIAFSAPKIIAVRRYSKGTVALDFEGLMAKYLYDDSNSYTDLSAGFSGDFRVTPIMDFSFTANVQKFSEQKSATNLESPTNAIEPVTGVSFDSSLQFSFNRNRLTHSLKLGHASKDYNDVMSTGGTLIDQDIRNTTSYSAIKSVSYTFSRYLKAQGSAGVDLSYSIHNPVRDATSYNLNTGVEVNWTSKLSTSFSMGLTKEELHHGPDTEWLPSYEASMSWTPTQKLTLSLNASRSERGTDYEEGSSSSQTESISGEMTYLVNKNLSVKAGTSYSVSDLSTTTNTTTDKTIEKRNVELSTQYAINRNMGLTLGYTYSERASTEANDSFEKEIIQGNIVTKF